MVHDGCGAFLAARARRAWSTPKSRRARYERRLRLLLAGKDDQVQAELVVAVEQLRRHAKAHLARHQEQTDGGPQDRQQSMDELIEHIRRAARLRRRRNSSKNRAIRPND